jgi:CubicO group peptidase (beta-lactamase class C family)
MQNLFLGCGEIMRKIKLLSKFMTILLVVILTGCTDTKTNSTESVKDKSKEIQSKLETKTSTSEAAKDETKEIQAKIEEYMKGFTENIQFNGSVLVAKNEQVLFKSGYGMADYENKIPNTPQTVFQIGSITKQFTATAILMLREKGLLDIQDTVDKYVPDYPNGNKIKIYNLLNQTSGIPENLLFVESIEAGKHNYTPKELIEQVKDKTLDFEPGTRFEYSNSNFNLLGYIIEKVTGVSYEEYIKNNIYTPLKMNYTGTLSSKDAVNGMATGYLIINTKASEYIKDFVYEPTLPYAAGEIYSNVEDLLIWNNSLCSGKLINENSLKEMFTPYIDNYGFGWFTANSKGDSMVFHGGNVPGFTSYITRNINKGYVVIILSNKNRDNDNLTFLSDQLLQIVSSVNLK